MIRLFGTLTGCALAVALLLLVVGIPQFRAPAAVERQAIVTLPRPTRPVEPSADASPLASPVESRPAPATAEAVPPEGDSGGTVEPADAFASAPQTPGSTDAAAAGTADAGIPPTEPQWYTFWSPFRSEIAANGFVARLQSVTGLDYRIVRVKPGVYEVSFAYRDDEEISGNLSRITAATGLDLAER